MVFGGSQTKQDFSNNSFGGKPSCPWSLFSADTELINPESQSKWKHKKKNLFKSHFSRVLLC